MAASKKTRFSWVGQFLAFVPGKKSPYHSAFVQVVAAEKGAPAGVLQSYQVKLDKDIRETASDSIDARDWVKVVGKGRLDKDTGEFKWKADSIEKVSLQVVAEVKEKVEARSQSPRSKSEPSKSESKSLAASTQISAAKAKPARILICQKSSCRKKGAQKVSKAMEDAISKAKASDQIILKSTGCLKCCKTGPTVVVLPAGGKSKKSTKERYRKVTPKTAKKIVAGML